MDEWYVYYNRELAGLTKTIRISRKNFRNILVGDYDENIPLAITVEELKAINEKVKELGWEV